MSAVGFEPTRSKTLRPERNPLDHSGKLTRTNYKNNNTSTNTRNTTRTNTRNTTNTTKHTHTTPRTHNTHNPHHKRGHSRTTLKHTPTHIQTRTLLARRMPPPSDSQMLRVKQERVHNTQHTTHRKTLQPKSCNGAPSKHPLWTAATTRTAPTIATA